MRYYLLGKKKPNSFEHKTHPPGILQWIPHSPFFTPQGTPVNTTPSPLSTYLCGGDVDMLAMMVPEKVLLSSGVLFDIVYPTSSHCMCFTRSYTHKVEGAGSVLQLAPKDTPCDAAQPTSLIPLRLRYFTPVEIAGLHGFPPSFSFPTTLTQQQCYRLIGNSLNVIVVAELMKYLLAR
jgi:hypothetical protein